MKDLTSFYAQATVREAAFQFLCQHFDCQRLVENAQLLINHPHDFRRLMIQFAEESGIYVADLSVFQRRAFATITEIMAMPAFLARIVYATTNSFSSGVTREELIRAEEEQLAQEGLLSGLRTQVIGIFFPGDTDNSRSANGNSRRSRRRASRQGQTANRYHPAARFAFAGSR
jgi:hypothetical protein